MTTVTWDFVPALEGGGSRPAARPAVDRAGSSHVRLPAHAPGREVTLKLTRRGRAVVTVMAVAMAVAAAFSAQSATADAPARGLEVRSHTVAVGETLWQIAGEVEADKDRRDVVRDLMVLNGLADGALQAGQQILVPVDGS